MATTITDRLGAPVSSPDVTDLSVIEGLTGTGVPERTGANTWVLRSITGANDALAPETADTLSLGTDALPWSDLHLAGFADFTKASTPANPTANYVRLYAKTGRNGLYLRDSMGTETRLWAGGGDVSVEEFGAVGDGVTDDLAAFNSALLCGATTVYAFGKTYRLSSGITVPGGVKLVSDGFIPGNPPSGAELLFDPSVATCVTLNGDGNDTCGLFGFTVSRAAGTIPAGSIGVLVGEGYQVNLQDVFSHRHAIGFKWLAAGTDGISSSCTRLYSGAIAEHHLIVDSWPELLLSQCRFGMNGAGDQNCTAYMRITGGDSGGGGIGPNTILCSQCQFNQGTNAPDYWLEFTGVLGEGSTAVEYKFTNCHVEGVGTSGIFSAADVSMIDRLTIIGCTFNEPTTPFYALNAATQPSRWQIIGNNIFSSTFNLAPTSLISKVSVVGNVIDGSASIIGASGSQLHLVGNSHGGNVTIAGSGWSYLYFEGSFAAGALSLTATGNIYIISGATFRSLNPFLAPPGSENAPTYTFAGDSNTGMFASAADLLEFSTGGTRRMFIDGGQVGTKNKLHVLRDTPPPTGGTTGQGILISSTTNLGIFFGSGAPTLSAAKGSLYIRTDGGADTLLYCNSDGSSTWLAVDNL